MIFIIPKFSKIVSSKEAITKEVTHSRTKGYEKHTSSAIKLLLNLFSIMLLSCGNIQDTAYKIVHKIYYKIQHIQYKITCLIHS